MPFYPKRRKYVRKGKGRKPYKKRAAKSSKTFVKKVQRIIHADVESKQAYKSLSPSNFNSGIDAAGDAIQVLPNISQGTNESSRIGNQLKAQNMTITGAISWSPSAGQFGTFANARLGVRIFVIQPRNYSDTVTALNNTATWMPTLLQKGSTTVGFTGQINDLWAPLNSEAFIKYYDKVIYLTGTYQSTAVGMSQLLGATKIFKIALKMRNKTLKYDTGISSGILPSNYAPIFCLGYAHMDGSGPDVLSTAVTCQWDAILNYEDA